jgi:hypothetical protein
MPRCRIYLRGGGHFITTVLLYYYDATATWPFEWNHWIQNAKDSNGFCARLYIILVIIWHVCRYYHYYRHVRRGVRSRVWHATSAKYARRPDDDEPAGDVIWQTRTCAIIIIYYVVQRQSGDCDYDENNNNNNNNELWYLCVTNGSCTRNSV